MVIVDTLFDAMEILERRVSKKHSKKRISYEFCIEDKKHFIVALVNGKEVDRESYIPLVTNSGALKCGTPKKAKGFDTIF